MQACNFSVVSLPENPNERIENQVLLVEFHLSHTLTIDPPSLRQQPAIGCTSRPLIYGSS
jgi:hypothetical protein